MKEEQEEYIAPTCSLFDLEDDAMAFDEHAMQTEMQRIEYNKEENVLKRKNLALEEKSIRRFNLFLRLFHQRLEDRKPNTAISAFMQYLNDA